MTNNRRGKRILYRITALDQKRRHSVTTLSLAATDDCKIDAALEQVGLGRADIFTPANAFAHRLYMAYMFAARDVDVVRAIGSHWEELKVAEESCLRCLNPDRCRRWLEWGGPAEAPMEFCPNAALFKAIAVDQTQASEPRCLSE